VRLIDPNGEQIGIVSFDEALENARDRGLDLVEVAPEASPPVCRILDFGKFKYHQKKKQSQKQQKTHLKEVRIGLNTEEHDLGVKARQVREFIEDGDRVLVRMRLRGREKAHQDMAMDKMREFGERFMDLAKYEKEPHRESSSRMSMMIVPK